MSAVELLTIFNGYAGEILGLFEGGKCRFKSSCLADQMSFS